MAPRIKIVPADQLTPEKSLAAKDYVKQGPEVKDHGVAHDFSELDKNVFTTFITIKLAFSEKKPEMMWGRMDVEGKDVEANDVLDSVAAIIEDHLEEEDANGEDTDDSSN